jgi:hypothetical protein
MKCLSYYFALIAVALALGGCAHDVDRMNAYTADYKEYVTAVKAVHTGGKPSEPKPLFELEAQPGQTIELKGVKRLAIHVPDNSSASAAGLAAQVVAPTQVKSIGSEIWAGVLDFGKTAMPFVTNAVIGNQNKQVALANSRNALEQARSNNDMNARLFESYGLTARGIAQDGFSATQTLGVRGFAALETVGSRPSSVVTVSGNNNAVGVQGGTAAVTTTTTTTNTTVQCPGGSGGNSTGAPSGSGGNGGTSTTGSNAGAASGSGGTSNAGPGGTTNCTGGK